MIPMLKWVVFRFRYLGQVVDEAIRSSAMVPMAARIDETKDLKIGGFRIPPNTAIVQALGVTLQEPKTFKEPNKWVYVNYLQERLCPHLGFRVIRND